MKRASLWKLILPAVLIFLGVALLCNNLGIVPGLWGSLIGLWPLFLIALGVALVLGWRFDLPWTEGKSMPFNEPLADVRRATLDLSGRAGELILEAASTNSQDLLGGRIPGGSHTEVEANGESAKVCFRREGPSTWWPWARSSGLWDLHLHPRVTWTLSVAGGIAETTLDLTELRVTDIEIEGQMGDARIKLPRSGQTTVRFGGHLGDLTVRVPDGVAVRIHQPRDTSAVARVNTTRFPQQGDVYETPGFETATDWVEIVLESSLGELRVL
jgi:hypothetical protein